MLVEISDEIFEQFKSYCTDRYLLDEPGEMIESVMKQELRSRCEVGYDRDELTKCKTRFVFERATHIELSSPFAPEASECRKSFLCFDIRGLRHYGDNHGFDAANELLIAVAEALRKQYGEENVYRWGGDEFVAAINHNETSLPSNLPEDIALKHSVLIISYNPQTSPEGAVLRRIIFQIYEALDSATVEGNNIEVLYV